MSEYRLPKRMRTDLSSRFIKMSQAKTSSKYEVLNFGIGEDTSLLNKSTVDLIYKELNTNESLGYSDNICPELVEAFSSYAKRNYGVELKEENIAITMGIKSALNLLAILLVDSYSNVLVTSPGYNIFKRSAELMNGRIDEYNLLDNEKTLIYYLNSSEKGYQIIELNYPNNPTGKSVTNSFYVELEEYAKKHNSIIINDGAYIDYSYFSKPISLLSQGLKGKLELYSASKSFGLTGLRVGIIAGDKDLIKKFKILQDQYDSGQARPFLKTYASLLNDNDTNYQKMKYYRRYYQFKSVVSKYDIYLDEIDSTFYAFFKMPEWMSKLGQDAMEVALKLKSEYSLIFIPYVVNGQNYLRASMTYKDESDIKKLDTRLNMIRNNES